MVASVDKTVQRKKRIKEKSKQQAFLAAYAETGHISQSAKATKITRTMHYYWLDNDPDYPALFEEADRQACQMLVDEATRRAVHGTEKPIVRYGEIVGTEKEYSDTLLIFLLKGKMPETFKERSVTEIANKDGKPFQTEDVTDDERRSDRVASILEAARDRRDR